VRALVKTEVNPGVPRNAMKCVRGEARRGEARILVYYLPKKVSFSWNYLKWSAMIMHSLDEKLTHNIKFWSLGTSVT
jgi:hypothetical protein